MIKFPKLHKWKVMKQLGGKPTYVIARNIAEARGYVVAKMFPPGMSIEPSWIPELLPVAEMI